MSDADASLLGAAIGAGITTIGALVVVWLQHLGQSRGRWKLSLDVVCEEMAENSNQLSFVLTALGIVRDNPVKPTKSHPTRLYLPFRLSTEAYKAMLMTHGSTKKARKLRRMVRSSYGLVTQVNYVLDECRKLQAINSVGAGAQAQRIFIEAEGLFVRTKIRHRDDLKKVMKEFSVKVDAAFASAVFASMFFEPTEKTLNQLAFADRMASELVDRLSPKKNQDAKGSPKP